MACIFFVFLSLLGLLVSSVFAENRESPSDRYNRSTRKEKLVRIILIVLAAVIVVSITATILLVRRRRARRLHDAEKQLETRAQALVEADRRVRLKRVQSGFSERSQKTEKIEGKFGLPGMPEKVWVLVGKT